MGTKITKYPNMKILPNDGIKFKCGCGCEFTAFGQSLLVDCGCLGGKLEIYYAHCPECQKCCTSDSNSTIHDYWNNENPNDDRPRMSYNFKKHLELKKMIGNRN